MDSEYLKDREQKSKQKPKHVGEGLLFGVRDLGVGLFKGMLLSLFLFACLVFFWFI
jgi:hypothetical protein